MGPKRGGGMRDSESLFWTLLFKTFIMSYTLKMNVNVMYSTMFTKVLELCHFTRNTPKYKNLFCQKNQVDSYGWAILKL